MLINLKPPVAARRAAPTEVIRRLQPKLAAVAGHHALHAAGAGPDHRGPRQPHAVPVHPRGSPTADELRAWVPRLVERLRQAPQLADVASDLQDGGLQAYVEIDRDTASRLGITPADDRQRALQRVRPAPDLDHLHAAEPVPRRARGRSRSSGRARTRSTASTSPRDARTGAAVGHGRRCVAQQIRCRAGARERAPRRSSINHIGQFPGGDDLVQPRARRLARATPSTAIEARAARARPAGQRRRRSFQGAALAFRASLANQLLLILAAIVTMYIVLGVLYESYIHPITILSTLPSAGVGALLALLARRPRPRHHRDHRHHPADRHREEERDHDDRLRARRRARARAWRRATRSTRPACCASARS